MIRKFISSLAAFLLLSTGLAANAATGANPSLSSYCSTSVAAYPSTSFGAKLLCDVASSTKSGTASAEITEAIEFKGKILFTAKSEEYGAELWITNGTPAGTKMLKDINPGSANSDPGEFALHTDPNGVTRVYFAATTAAEGRELWYSDGTSAGTVLLRDIIGGPESGDPKSLVSGGGRLYLSANQTNYGRELFYTLGSRSFATKRVSGDSKVGIYAGSSSLAWYDNKLYIAADGVNGNQLYSFDQPTSTLRYATLLTNGIVIRELSATPNGLYFSGKEMPNYGYELWRLAQGSLYRVEHLDGSAGRSPEELTPFRQGVAFSAYDPEVGWELFYTASNTLTVVDIAPGTTFTGLGTEVAVSSNATNFLVYKNNLYLSSQTGQGSSAMMVWDGSSVKEVGGTATAVVADSSLVWGPRPLLGSSLGLFFGGVSRTSATLSAPSTHSGAEPMLAQNLTESSSEPTLTSISPRIVNAGENITISGKNLANVMEIRLPDGTRCTKTSSATAPCSIEVNATGTGMTLKLGSSAPASTGSLTWQSYWGYKTFGGFTSVNESVELRILTVTPDLVYPGDQIVVTGTSLDSVIGSRAATLALSIVPGQQSADRIVLVVPTTIPDGVHTLSVSNGSASFNKVGALTVNTQISLTSVLGPAQDRRVNAGGSITISGTRLAKTNSVKIGGQVAQITATSETSVTATVPATLANGLWDVEVASAFDTELRASAVEVVGDVVVPVAPGLDTEFKVWTKRLNDGEAKMYAKNVVGQGKVTFVLNGEEIAWIRAADLNDRKLRIVTEGPMTGAHYLVRTVDLNPGRNVLEIYQDGERIRRTIYSNN